MEKNKTNRGFNIYEFKDTYGAECSLQKSSSAMEDKIWLGVNDANPLIMASQAKEFGVTPTENNGWVKYPIPKEVLLTTRMHLNRSQAWWLTKRLFRFAITGKV